MAHWSPRICGSVVEPWGIPNIYFSRLFPAIPVRVFRVCRSLAFYFLCVCLSWSMKIQQVPPTTTTPLPPPGAELDLVARRGVGGGGKRSESNQSHVSYRSKAKVKWPIYLRPQTLDWTASARKMVLTPSRNAARAANINCCSVVLVLLHVQRIKF